LAFTLFLGMPAALSAQSAEPASRLGAHGLRLPGSFVGDLPSAAGPALRTVLDLWPDQAFQLRRTAAGVEAKPDMFGRWHLDPDRRALVLSSDTPDPPQFEVMGNGNLRLLDPRGQPSDPSQRNGLVRQERFDAVVPRLTLRGMFLYFADAARFTECVSGRGWPVAMETAFPALQRAYLEARAAPQAPLLVRVEGRVAPRPLAKGAGTEAALVVDHILGVMPGEDCARAEAMPALRNTIWRVLTLRGAALPDLAERPEAYLLLSAAAPRYAATIGCNRLIGGFIADGGALRFQGGASTMMACPPPLDAAEQDFAAALAATAGYRIDAQRLTLLGRDSAPLATFEAAYLP
jgi:copper homeostasis protein (lipoprotein)